ncbi:MAG: prepilin-type N-terminal cleavage/methylation domain-containing protein [Elusimicrobia bacterium]|nr:prepilin-type N-terminal cleavage/methylation domain-containing protein [Elusimicrobiota bacterium]
MKRMKGFTLIELVITLIIVITLSLISWPIYRGRHREYSMLAEGYALLGSIKEAQINYYNEYGMFMNGGHINGGSALGAYTANDPVLRINAMNNTYFSWFNPYGTHAYYYDDRWKYMFTAIVCSKNAGTISLIYNLTERNEPVVSGAKNVTFF